ncbi:MAG: glycosyltransferase [Bacteroidota bacterium]
MTSKPKILIFTEWYVPGYLAGGPIRSVHNFAAHLQEAYEIRIVTSLYDLHQTQAYPNIPANTWVQSPDHAGKVFYFDRDGLSLGAMRALIQEEAPAFIYLNSIFSLKFSYWPLWIARSRDIKAKVVLATRGMLQPTHMAQYAYKKVPFTWVFRALGFPRQIRFHATDEDEIQEIKKWMGQQSEVMMVPNLPARVQEKPATASKKSESLSLYYISRISGLKNISYLLDLLMDTPYPVSLDIYGPIDEKPYWEQCLEKIQELPEHIQVQYCGTVAHQDQPEVLQPYHFLCLPTHGENFGHAIFESFVLGKPVLISNNTPWLQLAAQQMGWDIPLDQPQEWREALQTAYEMDQPTYTQYAQAAFEFARTYAQKEGLVDRYQALFHAKTEKS